jgi:hypothetical protein
MLDIIVEFRYSTGIQRWLDIGSTFVPARRLKGGRYNRRSPKKEKIPINPNSFHLTDSRPGTSIESYCLVQRIIRID